MVMKNKYMLFFLLSIFLLLACFGQLHAASGFNINSGRLYDANGSEFIIRGISHAHCWFTDRTSAISTAPATPSLGTSENNVSTPRRIDR